MALAVGARTGGPFASPTSKEMGHSTGCHGQAAACPCVCFRYPRASELARATLNGMVQVTSKEFTPHPARRHVVPAGWGRRIHKRSRSPLSGPSRR